MTDIRGPTTEQFMAAHIAQLQNEVNRLTDINAQLQSANDQLKQKADALEAENERLLKANTETNRHAIALDEQLRTALHDKDAIMAERNEYYGDMEEARHDLSECQKALDEAMAHKPVVLMDALSRRDLYILEVFRQTIKITKSVAVEDVIFRADALMAAADGRKP